MLACLPVGSRQHIMSIRVGVGLRSAQYVSRLNNTCQVMRKTVDVGLILSSDELTPHFISDKFTRHASHGQLRALCSQVEQITSKSLDICRLPGNIDV